MLCSCDKQHEAHKRAIADYLKARATWNDAEYKILALEIEEFTVADSIAVFTERAADSLAIRYDGRDGSEVLALQVGCKYGLIVPSFRIATETFETFVLTPDGNRVLGKAGELL